MTSNDSTTEAKFLQFSFPSFGDMLATSGGTPTATSSPLHNLNAMGLGAMDTSLGNPNAAALLGHHHHQQQHHYQQLHHSQQDVADQLSCLTTDNQGGNLQQLPQHQSQPQPHLELNQQQSQQPAVPGAGDMSNPTEGIITASLLSAMAAAHSIRFPHAQLNPSAPQMLNPQVPQAGTMFDTSVVNPADPSAQAAALTTTVKRKRRSSKANILQGNAPIMCSNCHAVNTPLWRTGEGGRTLCNKCGLYWKRNGTQRPPKLDRRRNSAPNVAATKQKRSPKRPRYDNPESSAAQDYSKTINLTFLESNGQGAGQAASQQSYNQEMLSSLIDRRMSIDDEMSRLSADAAADIRRMSVDESMVRSGQDRLDNINAFPQIDFSQLQSLSMQLNPSLPVNPNAQAQATQTYNKLYEIVQQQQQRIEELKKQIGIQQYLKQFSTTKSGANDFLLSASSPIGLSGSVSPSVAMTTSSAPDYSDQMSHDISSQMPQISVQPPQGVSGSPLQNQQAFSNMMNSMNYPLTISTNGTKPHGQEIFTLSPLLLFSPKTPDRDLVNNFLLELEQPGSTNAAESTSNFAVTPHKEPDTNSSNVASNTSNSHFSLNF